MLKEDEKKQNEIRVLKSKLAQLEEQEALLERICQFRHEMSKAWQMGDISRAQRLYNQAWEMERNYGDRSNQRDNLLVTKENIIKLARSMGLR